MDDFNYNAKDRLNNQTKQRLYLQQTDGIIILILLSQQHQYQMQNSHSRANIRTRTTTQRSNMNLNLKSSQNSQNYISRFTSQQSSRKATLPPSNYQCNPWNFLQARRESHLNTLFNIRKSKLDEITKANYLIYQKINTQQTYYPNKMILGKGNNYKNSHSRFYTLQGEEQQNCQNEQYRRILGPICNFKGLPTPSIHVQSGEKQHKLGTQDRTSPPHSTLPTIGSTSLHPNENMNSIFNTQVNSAKTIDSRDESRDHSLNYANNHNTINSGSGGYRGNRNGKAHSLAKINYKKLLSINGDNCKQHTCSPDIFQFY